MTDIEKLDDVKYVESVQHLEQSTGGDKNLPLKTAIEGNVHLLDADGKTRLIPVPRYALHEPEDQTATHVSTSIPQRLSPRPLELFKVSQMGNPSNLHLVLLHGFDLADLGVITRPYLFRNIRST